MNKEQITWFMQEIQMHCFGAEVAFKGLSEFISDPKTKQTRFVWFELNSFLAHSAMISKYLSPIYTSALKTDRKNSLREALKVDKDSDVLPRNARDNIEHFDERIDNWCTKDINTTLEMVFNDRKKYEFFNYDKKGVKRLLIMDEMIFISENRDGTRFELKLQPIFEEVMRIKEEAEQWLVVDSPYKYFYPY